jgi:maltooligosyltrehalose trehalohydrolase
MHVGTFSAEGTRHGASEKLPLLAETGVPLIKMMPIAAFAGTRNWGYDGVCWFARTHLHGRPVFGLLYDRQISDRMGTGAEFRRARLRSGARVRPGERCYWIREFHFDGLRLDATQQIFDDSDEHIVAGADAMRSRSGA